MTPEEEAGMLEAGTTQEEIDALKVEEVKKADEAKAALEKTPEEIEAEEQRKMEESPRFKAFLVNAQADRKIAQNERDTRVRIEQDNLRLKQEAEDMKRKAEEAVEEDSDKVLTVGEFNKRVNEKVAQLQKDAETKQMSNEAVQIKERFNEADAKGRAEFTTEKMGKGLDYDSVFKGTDRQIKENPAYGNVIVKAKNPEKEAYRIGLLDPQVSAIRDAQLRESTLTKIKTGGEPPKGGGGGEGGGGEEDLDIQSLLNLSPEELQKRTDALEKKQTGG